MKFFFKLFFLFLLSQFCLSQNTVTDSLRKLLPNQHDTVKVATLYKICAYFQNSNADSSLKYADLIWDLATKIKSVRWQANALNQKGYIKLVFHDYPKAIACLKEAIALYQAINNKKGLGNANLNLGYAYSDLGNYKESIYYNEQALHYYNEINSPGLKGNVFNNIALIYMQQRAFEKAKEYLDSAISCYRTAGEEFNLGNPILNLALIQSEKNDYDAALKLYLKALTIFIRNDDKLKIAAIYNNIGNLYSNMNDFKKSLVYLKKSIKMKQELEDTIGLATSYLNIVTNLRMEKKYTFINLYLDTAKKYVITLNNPEIEVYYFEEVFRYYYSIGDLKNADVYFDKYKEAKDSLINKDITKQLSDMSVKYDTEQIKLESLNKQKQFEHERKIKNVFTIFSICICVLLVVLILVLRKIKASNVLIKTQQKELVKAYSEMFAQKEIIEEKQREILDSIHYAKRIQTALLPSDKYIERNLNDLQKKD